MYLHIGGDMIVKKTVILGIFDMDNSTRARATRDFLASAERGGLVVSATAELPKSFVLYDGGVALSQLSSLALSGRF